MEKLTSNQPKVTGLLFGALNTLLLLFCILTSNAVAVESGHYLDNEDGTITDKNTGLMWLQKDSYLHTGHWISWKDTHEYILQLNNEAFAQHSDWRMPTTDELKSLYEPEKTNGSQAGSEMKIHTDPIFGKDGGGSLWSGEQNGHYNAFGVVFNSGEVFNGNKKSRSRKATRAVRNHTN
ncbi:MAG: DUF1566 domain-containing protein [Nitrospinaceae bacterium]|jgi:hypothetical protein|nr:DUF1566 domain-containing protein [Nitrospina sp.]MBT5869179.1 DUF1566 domain-containing protein [Nitrospinaceae bacterium]MBT6345568.1 DUF1566 domain-containing protein [Nitrospina sp.]